MRPRSRGLPGLPGPAYCHPVMPRDEAPRDEDLMLAYRAGQSSAFDALYRRHKGPLYRYLVRQCRDAHAAEELFQEIWLSVVRARESYTVSARFSTFLYRLAHNRLIDHYRRRTPAALVSFEDEEAAAEGLTDQRAEPHASYQARAQLERVLEVLDALPAAQREAFVLQQEAGMSIEQIAEATGVGSETAKSRLRYAMVKLREGLSEWL